MVMVPPSSSSTRTQTQAVASRDCRSRSVSAGGRAIPSLFTIIIITISLKEVPSMSSSGPGAARSMAAGAGCEPLGPPMGDGEQVGPVTSHEFSEEEACPLSFKK